MANGFEMDRKRLRDLLDAEIAIWAAKPFDDLVGELRDVVAYERGEGADSHQFEVMLLEQEDAYLHICISVDDGTFLKAMSPETRSFIVHCDGRVET